MARERSVDARSDFSAEAGPVRTCIGCRTRAARRDLVRVTVGADHLGHPVVVADPTRTAPGRGAHLHPSTTCYDLAVRRKAFGRALRVPAGISSAPLGAWLDQHHPNRTSDTRPTPDDQELEQQLMSTR